MSVSDLLSRLRELDIRLRLNDDRLQFDAPANVMTDSLRGEIVMHKEAIIQFLRAAQRMQSSGSGPIKAVSRTRPVPLSYAQQRLWFLDQLIPNSHHYNMLRALRLHGTLNIAALERSLNEVIRRHESLRTCFEQLNGESVQRIEVSIQLKLELIDLSNLPDDERERRGNEIARQEYLIPFDLTRTPLLRAKLLKLKPEEHWFLLSIHHIVADGWSLGILVNELKQLYDAYVRNRPSPLEPLPIQYADFTLWQRDWLTGPVYQEQLDYWKQKLAGFAALQLPTDHPRPAIQTYNGNHKKIEFSESMTQALHAFTRQEHVTLFMVLISAFYILLHRYSGQDDIVIGSPIANRNRSEIERLIGFFVNTLPLRCDLSGDPGFRELLSRMRDNVMKAYEYQDIPFEKLVEAIQPERDMSRNPLFQVMLVLQNQGVDTFEFTGLTVGHLPVPNTTSKFDLLFSLEEHEGCLLGVMEYNTDLYNDDTIQRMLGHYEQILTHVLASPTSPISQIRLLTESEEHVLLHEWNATACKHGGDQVIHRMFERSVLSNPDAVAVEYQGTSLSYRRLNELANDLAIELRASGAGPDVPVAIMLNRSLEMVISVLAVLKAGSAYVALDPSYPASRLSFTMSDTGAGIMLSESSLSHVRPAGDYQTILVDGRADNDAPGSDTGPEDITRAEHAAYLIYTSGSTGQPKGIVMSHGALCNLLHWQLSQTTSGVKAKTLQFASLGFDVSFQEIFSTWCGGGTLVVIPESLRLDMVALLKLIDTASVQRLFVPFIALLHLAEEAVYNDVYPESLREIITAGEQLQITPPIAAWFEKLGDCTLHNQYGPSESHVVTSYTLTGSPSTWPLLPPIGRPIDNARMYILDPQRRPVPVGVPGELYIGGTCLARGYLNRIDLTSEKFIADPFSTDPGSRLYRSGDLVHYLPDGNIQFLGRLDTQVKIRGFRIELSEIESVLSLHPAVKAVAVIAREFSPGDKRLVAYVTCHNPDDWPGVAELREFLQDKLPEYMLPSAFVQMDELPLSTNNKVDRQALPSPDRNTISDVKGYVAPTGMIETRLAEIWKSVMKLDRAGAHNNFFESGGHSLDAIRLISRVNQAFQVNYPLQAFFDNPTISAMAGQIEDLQRESRSSHQAPQLTTIDRESQLPLSFAQQRLWLLDQMEPGKAGYCIPLPVRLRGRLHVPVLEKALNELVSRHEVFRTRIIPDEGRPHQQIENSAVVNIKQTDLSALPPRDQDAALQSAYQEAAQTAFDLSQCPLFRIHLIQLADDEHILIIIFHHIIIDGWSLGVFVDELGDLYESYLDDHASPLEPLPIQYVDYAYWQRQYLRDQMLQQHVDYWKHRLGAEPPVLNLLTDRPRPSTVTYCGSGHRLPLSASLSDSLRQMSQRESVTLFTTLFTAFAVLLHRYSGQDDFVIGSPIAGRTRIETEKLIGFFVNMLPLRTDLSGEPTFHELLQRNQRMVSSSFDYQAMPFEKLIDELKLERDMSRNPLFQVTFALQNAPFKPLQLKGLEIGPVEMPYKTARYDIEVHVWERDGILVPVFIYNTDLFDSTTIQRMLEHYRVLLENIVSEPDRRISELSMLSDRDRHEILTSWSRNDVDYPRDASIQSLFEAQVEQYPSSIALVHNERRITYEQLNARSNQIAHRLIEQGVEQDTLVAFYMDRGPEMIAAMLGILKAGGAYVPLDMSYPAERLSFMISDTGVKVILTDEAGIADLPEHSSTVFNLSDSRDLPGDYSTGNPEPRSSGGDLAYVMYTSGSMGKPKGVMIHHRGVVRLANQPDYIELGPTACIPQLSNSSFDASTFEIWGALLTGCKLVLIDKEMLLSSQLFLDCIKREKINTMFLTTSVFNLFAKESTSILSAVDQVIFGGEAADPKWVRHALAKKPTGRLVNGYGPTECTTFACCFQVNSVPEGARSIPIGRPIANTSAYVLDARQAPVPVGVTGELYLGGDGLARGYLNRPELTAERFVPNPFSRSENDNLLYRTGDLVRWLPSGDLDYLGRHDEQVKVRGYRIELEEIRSVLCNHEQIADSVVILREDVPNDKRLVGYVVAKAGENPDMISLRDYLKKKLPDYMIPSALMPVEHIPLTPNGKVDRRALPAPAGLDPIKGGFVEPKTVLEKQLVDIWRDILRIDHIGLNDNFFDMGGNSLLIVRLRSRVAAVLKLDIPVVDLFRNPTIRSLVDYLGNDKEADARTEQEQKQAVVKTIDEGRDRLRNRLIKSRAVSTRRE